MDVSVGYNQFSCSACARKTNRGSEFIIRLGKASKMYFTIHLSLPVPGYIAFHVEQHELWPDFACGRVRKLINEGFLHSFMLKISKPPVSYYIHPNVYSNVTSL